MASFERVWAGGCVRSARRRIELVRRVGMGRRIDFLDDPEAPAANSLVPSVNVAVADDEGRLLVIRRSDNDNWALPGGAMDCGETIAQAAVRETKEETGIDCEITGLVGIYTNPRHVILYTSDGEVRQECSVVFAARAIGGEPTPEQRVVGGPVGARREELDELHDASVDAAAGRRTISKVAIVPYIG